MADKNIILYGPPGTGKTYNVVNYAVGIIENKLPDEIKEESREELIKRFNGYKEKNRIRFVTFHQSYGYEDFIEGIRPKIVKKSGDENTKAPEEQTLSGDVEYEVHNGLFKEFCDIARENNKNGNNTSFEMQDEKTCSEKSADSSEDENPAESSDTELEQTDVNEDVCENETAEQNSEPKNYVFIIDEINRGNISNIFGELITLIEPSRRAGEKDETSVILPQSKDEFSVPNNLYIIGTMNTADRSITQLDTALRRRFSFAEMMPEPELLKACEFNGINVGEMLETINKRIEFLYDREHTIGHAYFMDLDSLNPDQNKMKILCDIFKNKIIPLLQEYFFEDYRKIRLVLGDTEKAEKEQFVIQKTGLKDLFSNTTEIDGFDEDKIVYDINKEAFDKPESYIGIYSAKQNVNNNDASGISEQEESDFDQKEGQEN